MPRLSVALLSESHWGSCMMRSGRRALIALIVYACGPESRQTARQVTTPDSGFAGVQARGEVAMGVNQYTSSHVFEPLADGGRIELQRNANDSAVSAARIPRRCERSMSSWPSNARITMRRRIAIREHC